MDPVSKSPLYVLTNRTGIDGSRAVLSDRFLQEVAHQLGTDDLCLLPSSRNEMLADDIAAVGDVEIVSRIKPPIRWLEFFCHRQKTGGKAKKAFSHERSGSHA